jgi:two-component SAPR family response regulator
VNENPKRLRGLRVFIVEDEFAVLLLVEDMLAELGCEIVGTASRLPEAQAAAESVACDLAILDMNIDGKSVVPVAEMLLGRGLPVVFCTGYGRSGLDPRFRDLPVLQKPYQIGDLEAVLDQALKAAEAR